MTAPVQPPEAFAPLLLYVDCDYVGLDDYQIVHSKYEMHPRGCRRGITFVHDMMFNNALINDVKLVCAWEPRSVVFVNTRDSGIACLKSVFGWFALFSVCGKTYEVCNFRLGGGDQICVVRCIYR